LANGAATAIFSVIDAALLRPLPYEKPEEIVFVTVGETPEQGMSPSADDIERWRAASGVFTQIGMGRVAGFTVASVVGVEAMCASLRYH
jgi:hypothetical protein